jgi:hypothetical protein
MQILIIMAALGSIRYSILLVAGTGVRRENHLAASNHSLTNFIPMIYLMLPNAAIIIKICISISLVTSL